MMNFKNILAVSIFGLLPLTSFAEEAQKCHPSKMVETTPNSRFDILNDGSEVHDTKTNLVWQRCNIGQKWDEKSNNCTGTATNLKWKSALIEANKIGNGYRLPNIKELQSIIEYKCVYPALNQKIFKGHDEEGLNTWYWSSTPNIKENENTVFAIQFSSVYIQSQGKNADGIVRAVRFAK